MKNELVLQELGKWMIDPYMKPIKADDLAFVLSPEDLRDPDVQQFLDIVKTLRLNLTQALNDPLYAKGMQEVFDAIMAVSDNSIVATLRPIIVRLQIILAENVNKPILAA